MSAPTRPKFGVPPDRSDTTQLLDRPHIYPNVYEFEQTTGAQRIVIAPASDHVGMLRELASILRGPFGILYVLTLSRRDEVRPGRYQSPNPIDDVMLHAFLEDYREYFDGDGRHNVWVFSLQDKSTLVYDHHQVIYAYGPLDRFERIVQQRGLIFGTVQFPVPHTHSYNAEFDADEARIMSHWDWKWHPLQGGDDL